MIDVFYCSKSSIEILLPEHQNKKYFNLTVCLNQEQIVIGVTCHPRALTPLKHVRYIRLS